MEQYVAQQILKVRDALVERNLDEAYHQLYTLADPEYKLRVNPWEDVERAASQPSPAKAEQEGLWEEVEKELFGLYTQLKLANAASKAHSTVWLWKNKTESTTPPVKEAGQPVDNIGREEELIYRIVEQWGNAMCSMGEKVQWLKDYAAESRQRPAGESAVWVKGNYERLYNQIKGGKRTVCYIDHPRFFQQRDICTIKPNSPDMEFSSRGHGYGGINDPGYCGSEIERFIQLCRGLNAEWLDESGLASSREREVAIAFAEWISQEPHLFGSANYGWYYDIPIDGAGVEHKLIGDTNDLFDLYLQSTNNT